VTRAGAPPVAGPSSGGGNPPILELRGIAKRFDDCIALAGVDLAVARGTIHGLIGENGAGKTTLMRGVYGLDPPDAGSMAFDGRAVVLRHPREALALGIGMVHQHFQLVPGLSVLDNVILGAEPCRGPWLDRAAARARLRATCGSLLAGIEPDVSVDDLSVAGQQRVEIARLLYREARLLILDEPTAVLSPPEAARLFDELDRLRAGGRTVILITHRLADVLGHTDAVTLLRRGRSVAHRRTADTSYDELAGMLVATDEGAPAAVSGARSHDAGDNAPRRPVPPDAPPRLELRGVHRPPDGHGSGLVDVSLVVRAGEIVVLVGVDGSGPGEVIRVAAGRRVPASGTVTRPAAIGWIPEDRHGEAVVPAMSAAENLVLGRPRDPRFGAGGWLDPRRVAAHAERRLRAYDVRPAEPGRSVATLSGGNQQKLVLARETGDAPDLLVAAHPARGLDIRATRRVHDELLAARARGAAVLLMSAELDEARAVADRILVFYNGRIAGELRPDAATDEALGRLMTGGRLTEPVA
jgi:ABC-type uncharacterized transport system ATPase subunit